MCRELEEFQPVAPSEAQFIALGEGDKRKMVSLHTVCVSLIVSSHFSVRLRGPQRPGAMDNLLHSSSRISS